jgi:NodT family efflux transporter outer membrane factor (OMF) lipoprotein
MNFDWKWPLVAALLVSGLSACSSVPPYQPPEVALASKYKEGGDTAPAGNWKSATPGDRAGRGPWWQVFHDPQLDALEAQLGLSNQNLAQAEARYRQALATLAGARATQLPSVGANAGVTRSQAPGGRSAPLTNYNLGVAGSWETDLWGKLRANVAANQSSLEASALDLDGLKLSVEAQLAQNWFALRTLDAQQALLARTIAEYQKSLKLTQNQYAAGTVARENVLLAQTQLKSTEAQAIDLRVQRAQLEHAMALLLGKAPADFGLPSMKTGMAEAGNGKIVPSTEPAAPTVLPTLLPTIPPGLPSTLLERRPDIAAAERRVASANAQIGVAKAAYFPDLSLSASSGFQSSSFANWLSVPGRVWSLGPSLAQSLFDGGARKAQNAQALAQYDASVAAYRQTVLQGFQEVEDNLAALHYLAEEAALQDEALQAARQSVSLTENQYRAGVVSYLSVIQVQTTALASERTALDIQNRRLQASVALIKALGGPWQ